MDKRRFFVCSILPDGSLEMSPTTLSPEAAARRDLEAFLAFADKVQKVADGYRAERGQLKLFSTDVQEKG